MKSMFSSNVGVVSKVLDLRLERQNLILSNIANVNTPGYKGKTLAFEKELQNAMNMGESGQMTRTSAGHMPTEFSANTFQGKGIEAFKPRAIHGEDTVNLDKEMVDMAKNSMLYNALTGLATKSFSGINKIISDGSR